MSETNAERLDNCIKNLKSWLSTNKGMYPQETFDNYLNEECAVEIIKLHERVKELEMKYENSGSIFSRQNQKDMIEENKRLREVGEGQSRLYERLNRDYVVKSEENNRLREALEGLLHIEAVTQPIDYEELLKNVKEYVVDALEQSK